MLIFLGGALHFKAVKGAALAPDPNLGEARADLAVEAVLVHPEIGWCIAETNEPRQDSRDPAGQCAVQAAVPDARCFGWGDR